MSNGDLARELRASLRKRITVLEEAVYVASQMCDELNGVDLHEAAYLAFVARVGRDIKHDEEPSHDDYREAFLKAVAAKAR